MENKMGRHLRIALNTLILAVFALLVVIGRMQLWMAVFGFGLLISPFVGRVYCGWLCPISAAMTPAAWLRKKLGFRRILPPDRAVSGIIRWLALAMFLTMMGLSVTGRLKLPMLLLMVLAGAAVALLHSEQLWHRHICPFGTLLSITSKSARKGYRASEDLCNGCSKCIKSCPADAIIKSDAIDISEVLPLHMKRAKVSVIFNECLQCGRCADICPLGAIHKV